MYECDSSSVHVCLAAALIKFRGVITQNTCVCVCARSHAVVIRLNMLE